MAVNVYFSPSHQWTPLHVAAYRNHNDMVEHLVRLEADVNIKDDSGVSECDCC